MTLPRATVMVLVPGRRTLAFELDHRLPSALLAVLVCSALVGATARRCFDPGFGERRCVDARELTGSLHALAWPEQENDRTFVAVRTMLRPRRAVKAKPAALPFARPVLAPTPRPLASIDPPL